MLLYIQKDRIPSVRILTKDLAALCFQGVRQLIKAQNELNKQYISYWIKLNSLRHNRFIR